MWKQGAGRVREIAKAMDMPATTVYGILDRAGVWPGYDDHTSSLVPDGTAELELILKQYPSARRQIEINKQHVGKPHRDKVNLDLAKFMVAAFKDGYDFRDISAVAYVDAKTVAKYVRQITYVPPLRVVKPAPLAEAHQMSLPIQFVDQPKRGVLRRLWSWIFG
jgi:hypothetical protein